MNPTPAELDILNVLWRLSEATTQTVNAELSIRRPVGYTTTLKTMQLMTDKGLLKRRKEGKSHVYFAAIPESTTKGNLLDRFVNNTFGGSISGLMMQLLGKQEVSQEELTEVKALLKQLEEKQKG